MTENEVYADTAQEPEESIETYEPLWIDDKPMCGLLEEYCP